MFLLLPASTDISKEGPYKGKNGSQSGMSSSRGLDGINVTCSLERIKVFYVSMSGKSRCDHVGPVPSSGKIKMCVFFFTESASRNIKKKMLGETFSTNKNHPN